MPPSPCSEGLAAEAVEAWESMLYHIKALAPVCDDLAGKRGKQPGCGQRSSLCCRPEACMACACCCLLWWGWLLGRRAPSAPSWAACTHVAPRVRAMRRCLMPICLPTPFPLLLPPCCSRRVPAARCGRACIGSRGSGHQLRLAKRGVPAARGSSRGRRRGSGGGGARTAGGGAGGAGGARAVCGGAGAGRIGELGLNAHLATQLPAKDIATRKLTLRASCLASD